MGTQVTKNTPAARSAWMSRARSRAAAIGPVLLLVLSLFASTPAAAGGYTFTAEVLDLRALGNDEYRVVFRRMNDVYGADHAPPPLLVLHFRHDEPVTRKVSKDLVSKEKYLAAIELLKQQISQSAIIQLGVMGMRLTPIDGKPGEFSSYSLSIEEGVVYSWNGAID
jgi:hypothetical protein